MGGVSGVSGTRAARAARSWSRPWPWLRPTVLLLILAVLTANVLGHGPLIAVDQHIRAVVQDWARSPGWRWLSPPARVVTDLGSPEVAVPLLMLAAIAAAARLHRLWPLVTAGLGVVLLVGTVLPAKILTGRAGPGLPPVPFGHIGVFPSGHTATACICWSLAAAVLLPGAPRRAQRVALAGLAGLWAAVGAALVWCDYHWSTDVAASWALSGLLVPVILRLAPPTGRARPGPRAAGPGAPQATPGAAPPDHG